nr:P-II family nitrogen regulator [bacterium]
MPSYVLMTIIVNRSMAKHVQAFCEQQGVDVTLTALGHGTASNELLSYLGLGETDKQIVYLVTTQDKSRVLLRGLMHGMRLDIPGNGIAFTTPLGSIGGAISLQYLTSSQPVKECEQTVEEKKSNYEVIVAISNRGYVDEVMDAARSAHASGGTV